ncbi:hypothetical protein Tco_1418205 [Tanacetum coccineum]
MIKRSKCENKGIVPTEMELALEYTQQGASHEVSRLNMQSTVSLTLKHPSDTKVFTMKMEILLEPTFKQALGSFKDGDGDGDTHYERSHKGVKASANSDIIFFFTSAQDGNKLLDDERLSLADDLKKAHDQNQNKSK